MPKSLNRLAVLMSFIPYLICASPIQWTIGRGLTSVAKKLAPTHPYKIGPVGYIIEIEDDLLKKLKVKCFYQIWGHWASSEQYMEFLSAFCTDEISKLTSDFGTLAQCSNLDEFHTGEGFGQFILFKGINSTKRYDFSASCESNKMLEKKNSK